MRALTVGAVCIGLCACGSDPVTPARPPGPAPSAAAPSSPSALASSAAPAVSGSAAAPSASAAAAPPPSGELHLILRSPYPDTTVHAVPGGAFVAGHALLVAFAGGEARQDVAWLEGLPEFVNWDADVELAPPALAAPPGLAMPAGTLFSVHAGNVHGPGELRIWDGRTWARRFAPPSAARVRLQRGLEEVLATLDLPNGDLAVVGEKGAGTEARIVAAGGAVRVLPIGHQATDWVRAWLVGNSAADLHVCFRHGEIFALRQGGAVAIDAPGGTLGGCAITSSGQLWAVTDTPGQSESLQRRGTEWSDVDVGSLMPRQVSAAGSRVWVVAEQPRANTWVVLSTEGVATPLDVRDVHMPSPVFFGISSLEGKGPDLPSLSPAPAAPATRACRSLLIHLGPKPTAALRTALLADPGAAKLTIVRASGAAAGALVPEPPNGTRVVPSQTVVTALAAAPPSFDEGTRIVELLRKAALTPAPSLLCAVARNPKPLGTAEQLLP